MLMLRLAVLSLIGGMLASCANLQTVNRSSEMPDGGRAVHLDLPQRLVYTSKEGVVCAEPSPDGLQAYAASTGLGLSSGRADVAASVANALGASAASNGLRTQSITLMRDAMYRICEASHNKKITKSDVTQLLGRAQDLTLAVLAIEQLTGAVIARQTGIAVGGNASAAANIANTQTALDQANKNEAAKKAALKAAQDTLDTDQKALAQTKIALSTATGAEKQTLTAKKKEQEDAVAADQDAVKKATEAHDLATKEVDAIKGNLNAAITNGQATIASQLSFSGDPYRSTIDKDTVEKIATAATNIVDVVVNKGRLTDACLSLFSMYVQKSEPADGLVLNKILEKCSAIIDADLDAFRKNSERAPPRQMGPAVAPMNLR